MSYQFIHLETYSRKPNKKGVGTQFVFDEGSRREPSAIRHVENPAPPVLVFGQSMEETEREHNERAAAAKMTNNKGQTRSIRKDQKTLVTVILSHPGDDATENVASVEEWEKRSVDYLKKKYGDDLKTVIRHDDESHPHLHAYVIPSDGQMLANKYHPGEAAKALIVSRGCGIEKNRDGDKAYRQAMREWQDEYWNEVGLPCGMTRIGPARRRLSRAAQRSEEKSAESVRVANMKASEVEKTAEKRGQQKAVADFDSLNFFGKYLTSVCVNTMNVQDVSEKRGKQKIIKSANRAVEKLNKEKSELSKIIEQKDRVIKQQKEFIDAKEDTKKLNDYKRFRDFYISGIENRCDFLMSSGKNRECRDFLKKTKEQMISDRIAQEFVEDIEKIIRDLFGNSSIELKKSKKLDII